MPTTKLVISERISDAESKLRANPTRLQQTFVVSGLHPGVYPVQPGTDLVIGPPPGPIKPRHDDPDNLDDEIVDMNCRFCGRYTRYYPCPHRTYDWAKILAHTRDVVDAKRYYYLDPSYPSQQCYFTYVRETQDFVFINRPYHPIMDTPQRPSERALASLLVDSPSIKRAVLLDEYRTISQDPRIYTAADYKEIKSSCHNQLTVIKGKLMTRTEGEYRNLDHTELREELDLILRDYSYAKRWQELNRVLGDIHPKTFVPNLIDIMAGYAA